MGGEVFSPVLVQTEISRQISDGLPRNVVQTFVRMNHADFGDSPELFLEKCLDNYWMDCHKIWYKHSCHPFRMKFNNFGDPFTFPLLPSALRWRTW